MKGPIVGGTLAEKDSRMKKRVVKRSSAKDVVNEKLKVDLLEVKLSGV